MALGACRVQQSPVLLRRVLPHPGPSEKEPSSEIRYGDPGDDQHPPQDDQDENRGQLPASTLQSPHTSPTRRPSETLAESPLITSSYTAVGSPSATTTTTTTAATTGNSNPGSIGGLMRLHAIHRALQATLHAAASAAAATAAASDYF